jgi:hypothetical protein
LQVEVEELEGQLVDYRVERRLVVAREPGTLLEKRNSARDQAETLRVVPIRKICLEEQIEIDV